MTVSTASVFFATERHASYLIVEERGQRPLEDALRDGEPARRQVSPTSELRDGTTR